MTLPRVAGTRHGASAAGYAFSRVFRRSITICAIVVCATLITPGAIRAQHTGGWWDGFDLQGLDGTVYALSSLLDNPYFGLLAGGSFTCAGRNFQAAELARWRGGWQGPNVSYWTSFNPGGAWNAPVYALESWIDGSTSYVAIGGAFTASTGQPYDYMATYAENTVGDSLWGGVPGLNGPVVALTRAQSGDIVAGGFFDSDIPAGLHHVGKWNGASWDNMDGGLPGPVLALCTLGPDLILAGGYVHFDPSRPDRYYLAHYDLGSGHWDWAWDYLNGPVFCLFEDPEAHVGYVGGAFTEAGGISVDYIAVTDGNSITPLVPAGSGPNGPVHAISYYLDHPELRLLVGGEFTAWGDSIVNGVAGRWSPEEVWRPFGSGVNKGSLFTGVYALGLYRTESPEASLAAGGDFTVAGGYQSYFLGLWDDDLPSGDVAQAPGSSTRCGLDPNYPNPFNPETVIRYHLEQPTHVRLTVHDVEGRYVNTLVDRPQDEGEHQLVWDGRGADGHMLAGGVYFTRLTTAEGTATRKVIIAR